MTEPVTRADIREIVNRLGRIERNVSDLKTAHAVQVAEFKAFKSYLPSQIDGTVRDQIKAHGKETRELGGWYVGFIVSVLTILVTLQMIGTWIWS